MVDLSFFCSHPNERKRISAFRKRRKRKWNDFWCLKSSINVVQLIFARLFTKCIVKWFTIKRLSFPWPDRELSNDGRSTGHQGDHAFIFSLIMTRLDWMIQPRKKYCCIKFNQLDIFRTQWEKNYLTIELYLKNLLVYSHCLARRNCTVFLFSKIHFSF